MRYPSWLAIGLALSCTLGACSRAQNPRSDKGNWDEQRAREIAVEISRGWQFSTEDFHGVPATDLQRNVYAVLPFDVSGNGRWLLLLTATPPNQTCHACAPVTGGVIFARKDDIWQAVYNQSHIVRLGANGKPPTPHVQNLGPSKPAVAFEVNSMAQGYESTTLTLVAEVEGRLREVLSLETQGSNEAVGLPPAQTFNWRATVEASPSSKTTFWDILVKGQGTRPAREGQTRPYSATLTYRFNGSAYEMAR